jgi:hypothetical protein
MARLILVVSFLTIALLTSKAHAFCGQCDTYIWVLRINGWDVEGLGDMNALQCENARELIEPQTPPFTAVECVEVYVEREDS